MAFLVVGESLDMAVQERLSILLLEGGEVSELVGR